MPCSAPSESAPDARSSSIPASTSAASRSCAPQKTRGDALWELRSIRWQSATAFLIRRVKIPPPGTNTLPPLDATDHVKTIKIQRPPVHKEQLTYLDRR